MSALFDKMVAELNRNFGVPADCDCGYVQCCGKCCTDCHDVEDCDDAGCSGCSCKCHDDPTPCPKCHQAGEHKVGCELS